MLLASAAAVGTLAVLAAAAPGLLNTGGGHSSPRALPARVDRAQLGSPYPGVDMSTRRPDLGSPYPGSSTLTTRAQGIRTATRAGRCPQVALPVAYLNPLAEAKVIGERIDQGVDYAGSGSLIAIGGGLITRLERASPGWPGAFIEYRLSGGPDQGCYVYYAEGVDPVPSLHTGEAIAAGQTLAGLIRYWPTGIELGWGAGVSDKTYAGALGKWNPTADADNVATAAGKSFSTLITTLGGPPGKVEG